MAYRATYIPSDFAMRSTEAFDTAYMRALYDVGYKLAQSGKAWHDKPPS